MTRKNLIVANWKMNHGLDETIRFATDLGRRTFPEWVDVVVCPPFTGLYTWSVALGDDPQIKTGAQNCHWEEKGAFTGEVSPSFLKDVNCEYVIVGHSERRAIFGESSDFLSKKLKAVLRNDMKPIFCVGETLEQRESDQTKQVIETQLSECLSELTTAEISEVVIAYEPVWAIGTGKTATPAQAAQVHSLIRAWITNAFGMAYAQEMPILYGGSVKPENAGELLSQEPIDGALVGGASLDAESFYKIIEKTN